MPPFENVTYDDRPVRVRSCNSPGCVNAGDYRAPRNRELTDYYWFCLDHVREYNRSWDFFAGMNPGQVEAYNRSATVWERPSWPMGEWRQREQELRDAVQREFFGETPRGPTPSGPPMSKAEQDAMVMLELSPPVSFIDIKAQYRVLVKKHHPDANGGSRDAEERFKNINQAFAVLRQIYDSDES
jgi:hypothetical protein